MPTLFFLLILITNVISNTRDIDDSYIPMLYKMYTTYPSIMASPIDISKPKPKFHAHNKPKPYTKNYKASTKKHKDFDLGEMLQKMNKYNHGILTQNYLENHAHQNKIQEESSDDSSSTKLNDDSSSNELQSSLTSDSLDLISHSSSSSSSDDDAYEAENDDNKSSIDSDDEEWYINYKRDDEILSKEWDVKTATSIQMNRFENALADEGRYNQIKEKKRIESQYNVYYPIQAIQTWFGHKTRNLLSMKTITTTNDINSDSHEMSAKDVQESLQKTDLLLLNKMNKNGRQDESEEYLSDEYLPNGIRSIDTEEIKDIQEKEIQQKLFNWRQFQGMFLWSFLFQIWNESISVFWGVLLTAMIVFGIMIIGVVCAFYWLFCKCKSKHKAMNSDDEVEIVSGLLRYTDDENYSTSFEKNFDYDRTNIDYNQSPRCYFNIY